MQFHGIEICCPQCKGDLQAIRRLGACGSDTSELESLVCEACCREYPVLLGIPDLRVFPDPYIDIEADRAKGLKLAKHLDELSFEELVDFYYNNTPVVPAQHARQYTRALLTAEARSTSALAAWSEMAPQSKPHSGARLLEIGCGTGPMLVAASSHFTRIVGIDIAFRWLVVAQKRLMQAGERVPLICACAEALPFPDATFSHTIAESVIEHVDDQEQVLHECHRVTRKNGHLFVSTPNQYSLGPDPQTGIWGGGYLPKRWVDAVVRRQGGIPPKRQLLTMKRLSRLLYKTGFRSVQIRLPDIPSAQTFGLGKSIKALVQIYHVAKRTPLVRILLLLIGPFFHATGEKA